MIGEDLVEGILFRLAPAVSGRGMATGMAPAAEQWEGHGGRGQVDRAAESVGCYL